MRKLTLIKRSVPACPGCNVMKAMLDGEGIAHDTIDITVHTDVPERLGLTGVPAILIDGEVKFSGVTPVEQIREAMSE